MPRRAGEFHSLIHSGRALNEVLQVFSTHAGSIFMFIISFFVHVCMPSHIWLPLPLNSKYNTIQYKALANEFRNIIRIWSQQLLINTNNQYTGCVIIKVVHIKYKIVFKANITDARAGEYSSKHYIFVYESQFSISASIGSWIKD